MNDLKYIFNDTNDSVAISDLANKLNTLEFENKALEAKIEVMKKDHKLLLDYVRNLEIENAEIREKLEQEKKK